jgi:hypothetical protein
MHVYRVQAEATVCLFVLAETPGVPCTSDPFLGLGLTATCDGDGQVAIGMQCSAPCPEGTR